MNKLVILALMYFNFVTWYLPIINDENILYIRFFEFCYFMLIMSEFYHEFTNFLI